MTEVKLPESVVVIERGWLSSNNILLFAGTDATLIDAGYVGHAPQTVELIKSVLAARHPPARLQRLINTHSHSDHIGGNSAVQAAFGCEIYIPAGIEDMVANWDEDALLLTSARQRADRFAHDGVIAANEEFEMGGFLWKALPAPGHDMAALVYYCAEQRLLISGDALWQDGFGIIFGELMGNPGALSATRGTLEMIGRLDVQTVIPGHGPAFEEFDVAMTRAFARLASFEQDGSRMGRNAVKACFTFNLLDLGRLREDELPAYLTSVPFFHEINLRIFGMSDADFATWLLADLKKSRAVEVRDGWVVPMMAP